MSIDFGGDDLAAMLDELADLGATVEVVFGAVSVRGLLDKPASELFGDSMPGLISADECIHVRANALPGMLSGSEITVDGVAKVVRDIVSYGDGSMVRVSLRSP